MKYSRGRIIALTILSVTVVLALFGASLLYNFRDTFSSAVAESSTIDPNYIPTFDDLYEKISFSAADTGTTELGQRAKLTLTTERYERGILTEFLNAKPISNRSYRNLQSTYRTSEPYPVFSNVDMRSIAKGLGNSLEIPVVMLDPFNYDDIVLFELTNIEEMPTNLSIKRDGVAFQNGVNLHTVDNTYAEENVYRGVPSSTLTTMSGVIYDTDKTTALLNVIFAPSSTATEGYIVEIKNTNAEYLYMYDAITNQLTEAKTIGNGRTELCDANGNLLYIVNRDNNSLTVNNQSNVQLGQLVFNQNEHQYTSYSIGAVAYNTKALRGMFRDQGVYEISFKQMVSTADGVYTPIDVSFTFIIVNKANYINFPRFNTNNRVPGNNEIYNYSYESEYPVVNYRASFFDVKIATSTKYYENPERYEERELKFYNIGEYQMVSTLQYYSDYLYNNRQSFNSRGVDNGYVTLKRYQPYASVLNILGFQAYYGGQHASEKYNGPLPFYDSANANISSDISAWVRSANLTADKSSSVVDYTHMRVTDALKYSNDLANYITSSGTIQPVRTNFPPVKMSGNVAHATGTGVNGEKAVVLSTVAFRPFYGTGHTSEWTSKTLEVGAPFEDAGQYLVVIYFKVNNEICQQTFYFEITNSANIAFEVTANNETKKYYAGELEINKDLHIAGNQVRLSYDGKTTLGKFEVLPMVTLAYAEFGKYTYVDQNITMQEDGTFEFSLIPGQYRLTIKYGAHGKSTTIFNIVVDDTQATGIRANTQAKSLADVNHTLPDNVAIVGAGDVSLTWNCKSSGINFASVDYEFYEMVSDKTVADPNLATNYAYFPSTKVTDLYSAYSFAKTISISNSLVPKLTESGWTVSEKFSMAGLYRFNLIDEVGNETPYVLIIDNSTPTFIQSGSQPTSVSNTISFDDDGIKIGFGKNKLIKRSQENNPFGGTMYQPIFASLGNSGVMTENKQSIKIPLARVEWSVSGDLYRDVAQTDINNGYLVLNQEGTYYFRVTDVLGNVGEYYIVLTHDSCFGMVYAEENPINLSTDEKHSNRGMITATPDSGTSLVTSTGGMTNRPYVTFSFEQKAATAGETYRVETVYLQYYPFTYDVTSANYPFSEHQVNRPTTTVNGRLVEYFPGQDNDGRIYLYNAAKDSSGGTIRLALFNDNTITPSGMYIITRVYASNMYPDTWSRDYYFIVDNQKMLYYADDYQTTLKIRFAESKDAQYPKAKDADAEVLSHSKKGDKYELSSNRTAWITGFNSKYSWKHDTTNYEIKHANHLAYLENNSSETVHRFDFPALTPRFSYINNGQTVALGEGKSTNPWVIGDPASRTDSPVYDLIIADNARNLSCVLVDGNVVELKDSNAPTSANWDCITLNLDTGFGTKAEIVTGENNIISNSDMQYDGNNYWYILDPRNVDQLQFRFNSDPASMYADVDLSATTASWIWKVNGVTQSVSLNEPIAVNGVCTFDLMEDFLNTTSITNGASLSVSLITCDNTRTNYIILFDSFEPKYNLNRIRTEDNLASTMDATELPGDYVYGLSANFVFESDRLNNPYLDAKTITYREVDYTGEGSQQPIAFSLYTGATGEERIPFATLIGLRDNEMKYYYITETDYAGHITSYMVQVQGINYVNAVTFIGAISDENDEIQIGVEMSASASSVHEFFLHNNSFKFESGDEYYTVLGSRASWHIGNDSGNGVKSEENLINALNNWINVATEKGTKCSYKLYDRIGDVEVFEFYNLREDAVQMQLDCYQPNITSNMITLEVTNLNSLPRILSDKNLTSLFQIEVEDKTTSEIVPNIHFSLSGTTIYLDVSHEFVIKVTDPFGRVSTTEYHKQSHSTINFSAYGNTVTRNGIIYVGDERGVSFSYLRTVYTVLIYDANTDTLLNDLQSFISNDMIYYTFKPQSNLSTVQMYHIVATGRASGAILFDKTFAFDTRLPNVEWKNASDQLIEVEGQSFVSAVTFDISRNTLTTMFPVTISYTRTLNNQVESVTLKPDTNKVTFYQEGKYEVTLRNTVWAKQTFKFEIVQINDTLVVVKDDGKQIQASDSDYKYTVNGKEIAITRYIFSTTFDESTNAPYPITQYDKHGLEILKGQTNRILAGRYENGWDYYDYDPYNETLIWRLALKVSEDGNGVPTYTNPIYFATTGVNKGRLPSDNSIRLKLNGNPTNTADNNPYLVPLSTGYNFVYNNFMTKARGEKLTVQLYCDDSVCYDDKGAPCYSQIGNLILVDCYYNGILVKTLKHNDVFTINQSDAGYYEFKVHDLIGNYLYFGSSDDESDVNYQQDRYLLAVMTKPVVEINGNQPVGGMIYNDQVELKMVDYGSGFLKKYYNLLASSGITTLTNKDFFEQYFCVTEIEVTYSGSNGTTKEKMDVSGAQNVFYWNQSGKYHIILKYRIYNPNANNGGEISSLLTGEYSFQIIPSLTVSESFNMSLYPNIPVISITRDGYNIHNTDNYIVRDANDTYISFDANNNPGKYVVTMQAYNAILQTNILYEISFNIQHKTNSASTYFILSGASGSSTVGSVTLYYNPYWLYLAQGDVTITLTKDYVVQQEITVDSSVLADSYSAQELFTTSGAGIYRIAVRDAEGDIVYSDSWTIEQEQSTFGYVILAVVLGIAGIGALIFIRMRHKMTTK